MAGLVAPVDPNADPRPFYQALVQTITQLQRPAGPVFVHSIASTALPPASAWPGGVLRVSDLDILAVSNGVAWIRQDTGAAI